MVNLISKPSKDALIVVILMDVAMICDKISGIKLVRHGRHGKLKITIYSNANVPIEEII